MKIEVGKIYLDTCGDAWEVLHFRAGADFPFTARTIGGSLVKTFSENGRTMSFGPSEYDLIKEAPEVATLHLYRDSSGDVYALSHRSGYGDYIKTIEVEL